MVGHDNLGYAIFQNEKGEIRTTTNIEASVKHKDGSYFVETARITHDGLVRDFGIARPRLAIAGLTDPSGRVLGLMPHPEAFHHVTNYPTWTRGSIDVPPATQLFSNAVRYLRAL